MAGGAPGPGHVHQEEGCSSLIHMKTLGELGWSRQLSMPHSLLTTYPESPSSTPNTIRLAPSLATPPRSPAPHITPTYLLLCLMLGPLFHS